MLASIEQWREAALPVGILVLAVGVVAAAHYVVFLLLGRVNKRSSSIPEGAIRRHFCRPTRWIAVVIAIRFVLPLFDIAEGLADFAGHIISLLLIGCVFWLVIKGAYFLEECAVSRFDLSAKDNLQARKIYTQLRVAKRIFIVIVVILAAGTMLMTFPKVRQVGTTILASAGIIGIVVGMAAQRTIGTFIAGLQIAFTQPIRVDDVVIVENEWGRIEEITLTYVVVKIWDLRRLIVPITYFIERPFQNWTRKTADILGTVFIYVDYTVPFAAIREQLQKILSESELWDKKVCVLQVTNATERTVELRALMSAADASTAWSLRCEVREKLIEFVRDKYPQALPKFRAEFGEPKKQRGR